MRDRAGTGILEGPDVPEEEDMSVLDKIKGMLKGHEDQAHQAVEKAGDMFDAKTGNKYSSQVDKAQEQADKQINNPPPAG
jgi:hypothetical protein